MREVKRGGERGNVWAWRGDEMLVPTVGRHRRHTDQEVSANPSEGQGRASLSSESSAENVCLQLPWLLTSGCSLSSCCYS